MVTTEEDVACWTDRVAELERQLDAAVKLSEVRMIAGELMRTRAALARAKAKLGMAARHPKREKSVRNERRNASSAAEPASA
jgi:hypothetical protein